MSSVVVVATALLVRRVRLGAMIGLRLQRRQIASGMAGLAWGGVAVATVGRGISRVGGVAATRRGRLAGIATAVRVLDGR